MIHCYVVVQSQTGQRAERSWSHVSRRALVTSVWQDGIRVTPFGRVTPSIKSNARTYYKEPESTVSMTVLYSKSNRSLDTSQTEFSFIFHAHNVFIISAHTCRTRDIYPETPWKRHRRRRPQVSDCHIQRARYQLPFTSGFAARSQSCFREEALNKESFQLLVVRDVSQCELASLAPSLRHSQSKVSCSFITGVSKKMLCLT